MADCAALQKAAEAARQNWQTKHAASCSGEAHSAECKAAYDFYLAKSAEYTRECGQK